MGIVRSLKRAVGFHYFERGRHGWLLKTSWAEVNGSFGLGLGLCNFGEDYGSHWTLHFHLGWPNLYIRLPFLKTKGEPESLLDRYGFSLCGDSYAAVHFNWGDHYKIVNLPWASMWVRTSTLAKDGTWMHDTEAARLSDPKESIEEWRRRRDATDAAKWQEEHPYTYVLKSGEVQNRKAKISVTESERRPLWFKWTRLFASTRRYIDVSFSDEVGERTGSWKGGTVGCAYEMAPGETPRMTLRRMEAERKF